MNMLLYSKWTTSKNYCVARGALLSVMGQPDGSGVCRRMNTHKRMAESLSCPPETTTTLLMAIPQYKIKSKVWGKKRMKKKKMANFK